MAIIGWIIFGLIVGIVAKFLMPGRDPGGFIITALLGIAGGAARRISRTGLGLVSRGRCGGLHHGRRRVDHLAGPLSVHRRTGARRLSAATARCTPTT